MAAFFFHPASFLNGLIGGMIDAEVKQFSVVEEEGLHIILLDESLLLHDAVVQVDMDGDCGEDGVNGEMVRYIIDAFRFLESNQRMVVTALVKDLPAANLHKIRPIGQKRRLFAGSASTILSTKISICF